jgi:NADH-quinone oxidoreductase subunit K
VQSVGLIHFLIVGLFCLSVGLLGVLGKRSIFGMLLSLELMFSGINISLIAFSYFGANFSGQSLVLFVLAGTGCESVLALSLIVLLYRQRKTTDVENLNLLKG